jgi:hypothetical protein
MGGWTKQRQFKPDGTFYAPNEPWEKMKKNVPNGLKNKRSQHYTPQVSCYRTRETGGSWRDQFQEALCQCGSVAV